MRTRSLTLALLPLALTSCLSIQSKIDRIANGANPYEDEGLFYMRYVGNESRLDRSIRRTVEALQKDPQSAALHNDLGALLLEKGFSGDAEREFSRAVYNDPKLYAAWYNLGLLRETQGDMSGSESALRRTLALKPGHAAAHFQLGLIDERRGRTDSAIRHYARAFRINRALLDARVNPRILDTKLADRALLSSYELDHAEASAEFQATPAGYTQPRKAPADSTAPETASPQAAPGTTISPSAAPTDLSNQAPREGSPPPPPPAKPPSQNVDGGATSSPVVLALRPNATPAATTP